MKKKTPAAPVSSMPTWETLEAFVRTGFRRRCSACWRRS